MGSSAMQERPLSAKPPRWFGHRRAEERAARTNSKPHAAPRPRRPRGRQPPRARWHGRQLIGVVGRTAERTERGSLPVLMPGRNAAGVGHHGDTSAQFGEPIVFSPPLRNRGEAGCSHGRCPCSAARASPAVVGAAGTATVRARPARTTPTTIPLGAETCAPARDDGRTEQQPPVGNSLLPRCRLLRAGRQQPAVPPAECRP